MSPNKRFSPPALFTALAPWLKQFSALIVASRPLRAWKRFTQANGPTLCGGIAYTALFSIFGALTIGYTVFSRILGGNEELMDSLLDTIDDFMPGLLKINGKEGLIAPNTLILESGLTLTSVIAGVVLLWAALGCMSAIRRSTRAMFDLPVKQSNMALAKLRELTGLGILGLSVLVVTVASVSVTAAGRWFIGAFNLPDFANWAIPTGTIFISFLIDGAVFLLVVRVLAGVQLPTRDKLLGAGLSALGFGALRQVGTALVASSASNASSNFVVASLAVFITLLLWVNLSATIFLVVCAFAANPTQAELDMATPIPGQQPLVTIANQPVDPISQQGARNRALILRAILVALAAFQLGKRAQRKQAVKNHTEAGNKDRLTV